MGISKAVILSNSHLMSRCASPQAESQSPGGEARQGAPDSSTWIMKQEEILSLSEDFPRLGLE